MRPQGFWGSGENGYLFSGSWGALVIILGERGSKLIIFGDLGSLAKKQRNKENFLFCLFDLILYVPSTIFQLYRAVLPGLNQY